MRNFIYKLFFLFLMLGGYFSYFSMIKLDAGKIGVVEDLRNNTVVKIFYEKKNFIWQGSFPWWYSTYEISSKKSIDYEILLPVYGLDELKGEQYQIKTLCNVLYRLNLEKFSSFAKIGKGNSEIDEDIKKHLKYLMLEEFNRYFNPAYKGNLINNEKESIIVNIYNKIKSKLDILGLDILSFDISGRIIVPDFKTYLDGIRHMSGIRDIEKRNEVQVKILESKISQDKISDKQKYDKLNEISKIIKDNPDILKYIYIDKMSDNVKIIISSDKSAFPLFLDDRKKEKGGSRDEDMGILE